MSLGRSLSISTPSNTFLAPGGDIRVLEWFGDSPAPFMAASTIPLSLSASVREALLSVEKAKSSAYREYFHPSIVAILLSLSSKEKTAKFDSIGLVGAP